MRAIVIHPRETDTYYNDEPNEEERGKPYSKFGGACTDSS